VNDILGAFEDGEVVAAGRLDPESHLASACLGAGSARVGPAVIVV